MYAEQLADLPNKVITPLELSENSIPTSDTQKCLTENHQLEINCVIVGDEGVGKSRLLNAYLTQGRSKKIEPTYFPTTREEYTVEKELKDGFGHNRRILLNLVDTGGQKELDRLRPLCYNSADVFILCFSVVVPSSFQSLQAKWIPEIQRHSDQNRNINLFLVGTQSDLRSNTNVLLKLSNQRQAPVSESRAIRFGSKIGARNYVECSSKNYKNIRQIFDYVMITGLHERSKGHQENRFLLSPVSNGFLFPNSDFGKRGRHLRQVLSKQWSLRKCYKLKRLILFSCFFN